MIRDPRKVSVHPVCHDSGCRSYVVIAPESNDAAVVDPLRDKLSQTLALLDAQRGKLRWIIETHSHGDHLSGAALLAERTGAEVVSHPVSPGGVGTTRPADGDVLPFGEHGLRIHHAPGNAVDALVVEARGCFFTGDTLLIGTVGLQDTGTVDGRAWFESLDRIFRDVPDETVVHPGHDDMGRDKTTLKSERTGNLWLRTDDLETFLTMVASDERQPRKDRDRVLEANREGVRKLPSDLAPAEGLTAPAEIAEIAAAASRGHAVPTKSGPPAAGHHGVMVIAGLLAAAGTILGWLVNPNLHALSLVAAVILLAVGMPGLERARRRKDNEPTLYYQGPQKLHPLSD